MSCGTDYGDCARCRWVAKREADLERMRAHPTAEVKALRDVLLAQQKQVESRARRTIALTREIERLGKALSWQAEGSGGALVDPPGTSCSAGTCGIGADDNETCEDWAATYLAAGEVLKNLGAELRQVKRLKELRVKVLELGGDYAPAAELDGREETLDESILKATKIAGDAIRRFFYGDCVRTFCPTHPEHPLCRTR